MKIRKRRTVIAVTTVVGILFVCLLAKLPSNAAFFDYLVRHPTACNVAGHVFRLAGQQQAFENGRQRAMLAKSVAEMNVLIARRIWPLHQKTAVRH